MLNDAQTSGGLLISVNNQKVQILLEKLSAYGVKDVMEIGKVAPFSNIRIKVV
jgi:selenophosphate synthase